MLKYNQAPSPLPHITPPGFLSLSLPIFSPPFRDVGMRIRRNRLLQMVLDWVSWLERCNINEIY